jgi:hypothetical protein
VPRPPVELCGRTMVVFVARHYAAQLVLATSQRRGSVLPRSHKDTARKAFERVTKTVLPGSFTQLQRALNAEAHDYQSKLTELETRVREERAATAAQNATQKTDAPVDDVDEAPDDGTELDEEVDVDGD